MNQSEGDKLESLWDQLLSRDENAICQAFTALDEGSQEVVRTHLARMAGEPGWHPEQRKSAQYALDSLKKLV
jgi:hypothetical protein